MFLVSTPHVVYPHFLHHKRLSKLPSSVIRQEYSWGRFRATQELFQKILTYHDVFPPFIDAAHAFGFKTDEDDKVWDGFRASISDSVWEDKSHARFGTWN
jgi:hypothetical protein